MPYDIDKDRRYIPRYVQLTLLSCKLEESIIYLKGFYIETALTLSTLNKFSADDILKYFSYFSLITGFNVSCKLFPLETVCMKPRILFSGEKRKILPICHLLN